MNFTRSLFFSMLLVSTAAIGLGHKYSQEFQALEANPEYKTIFDEEAHSELKRIQRNIQTYQELSLLQRMVRFECFGFESIIITQKNMPELDAYIAEIARKNDMDKPVVFVALNKGFFNAFALKILASSGAIVIGKQLLLESTQEELEAVITHEMGHIKYNHVNKRLLLNFATFVSTFVTVNMLTNNSVLKKEGASGYFLFNLYVSAVMSPVINYFASAALIGKRFEREADEFAYNANDQSEGLKGFCQRMIDKDQKVEELFEETLSKIEANKDKMSESNYNDLKAQHNTAKMNHSIVKAFSWIYHETPFGSHPSAQARIKAIEEYQAKKAATF